MKKLLVLLTFISAQAFASGVENHKLYGEKLSIDLPIQAQALSKKALKKRYGSKNAPPQYAFSNKDQNVSFTMTQYGTPADKKSMKKIHMQLSAMLHKANPNAKWKKDKTNNKFGTKVAIFEYENAPRNGKYQYNITYAFPLDNKLTFLTFLTTEKKYKAKWVNLARESLATIALN